MPKSTWNSIKHSPADALNLSHGRYYASHGGSCVAQVVREPHTLEAANALAECGEVITATSQAQLIVIAYQKGLAFQNWAPIKLA
jgi:hypothetical protein